MHGMCSSFGELVWFYVGKWANWQCRNPDSVGVIFVFQHRLFRVLSWKHPTHTISAMAVYSFICLDPHLLAVLPVVATLLFIMVPAFITRHPPPPPSIPGKIEPYSAQGGPIAPPPEVRAVSEMSKVRTLCFVRKTKISRI